jgi:SHS2 domain-containing protein
MTVRILDHTADYMVEIGAASLGELFEEAGRALTEALTDPETVEPLNAICFACKGQDREELLVGWLTELLYLYESQRWLFSRFHVLEVGSERLRAEAWGEPLDPGRHLIEREIKAVTYHALSVEEVEEGFRARIVFDL